MRASVHNGSPPPRNPKGFEPGLEHRRIRSLVLSLLRAAAREASGKCLAAAVSGAVCHALLAPRPWSGAARCWDTALIHPLSYLRLGLSSCLQQARCETQGLKRSRGMKDPAAAAEVRPSSHPLPLMTAFTSVSPPWSHRHLATITQLCEKLALGWVQWHVFVIQYVGS